MCWLCHTTRQVPVCVWTSSADGEVIPAVYPTLVIEECSSMAEAYTKLDEGTCSGPPSPGVSIFRAFSVNKFYYTTTLIVFFFFITLKPGVERYTKFMSLEYEPDSEPLWFYCTSKKHLGCEIWCQQIKDKYLSPDQPAALLLPPSA